MAGLSVTCGRQGDERSVLPSREPSPGVDSLKQGLLDHDCKVKDHQANENMWPSRRGLGPAVRPVGRLP